MPSVEEQVAPVALRADAARNRERIVAAAQEIFAERGLDVSTAEIAERAGVGEATLFRRFPTKFDLIDAVLETKMRGMVEFVTECADDPDPARGIEHLFVEMIESKMQTDQGFQEAARERCLTNRDFDDLRKASYDVFARLLRRAQEAGVVREDLEPQDLHFLLMAAATPLASPIPGLRPDLFKRYARVILDGIKPEGASKLSPPAPPRKLLISPGG